MSAISLILLVAAGLATALGGAALLLLRGVHRELAELGGRLDATLAAREAVDATVPAARTAPAEIRTAVAAALADERERELAEARAFWAAQETRGGDPAGGPLLAGHGTEYEVSADADHTLLEALLDGSLDGTEGLGGPLPDGRQDGELFVPRQHVGPEDALADDALTDPYDADFEADYDPTLDPGYQAGLQVGLNMDLGGPADTESAEFAAARRRHPSHPDFNLSGEPVGPSPVPAAGKATLAEHERTVHRLGELADARTPLLDVRPGPLGTLDIYAFEDGTTVCMSPGHRETAEQLSDALDAGLSPLLLGGSSVSGAYSLTFEVGEDRVYLLADRVITSL